VALFTTSDRESVKDAIVKLATGDRVVQVTVQGRTTSYQQAGLAELRALLSQIDADLATSAPRHFVFTSGGKGL
jgi:hypothetical protein